MADALSRGKLIAHWSLITIPQTPYFQCLPGPFNKTFVPIAIVSVALCNFAT